MEAHINMQIPMFDGKDHEIWSIKMKTLLMSRDLWDVVETGVSEEDTKIGVFGELATRQKDLKIKDMTALHMLQMSVTDSIFLRIGRATSSKQAWEILKAEFDTDEIRSLKVNRLRTEYAEMIMADEESVLDYTKKMMQLVTQLKFYGSDISDKDVILKILSSLPSRFGRIAESIRVSNLTLTLTKVVYILRVEECEWYGRKKREASRNPKRGRE